MKIKNQIANVQNNLNKLYGHEFEIILNVCLRNEALKRFAKGNEEQEIYTAEDVPEGLKRKALRDYRKLQYVSDEILDKIFEELEKSGEVL